MKKSGIFPEPECVGRDLSPQGHTPVNGYTLALLQTFLSEFSSLGPHILREATLCFLGTALGLALLWVVVAPEGRKKRKGGR